MNNYPQSVVEINNKGSSIVVEQASPYHYHIKIDEKIKHLKLTANEVMQFLGEQISKNSPKVVSFKKDFNVETKIGKFNVQTNHLDENFVAVEMMSWPCLDLPVMEKWKKNKTFNQKAKAFALIMKRLDSINETFNFKNSEICISSSLACFSHTRGDKDIKEEREFLENWYIQYKNDEIPLSFQANFEFKTSKLSESVDNVLKVVSRLNELQNSMEKELDDFFKD